jgi:hypothetical protein
MSIDFFMLPRMPVTTISPLAEAASLDWSAVVVWADAGDIAAIGKRPDATPQSNADE